MSDSMYSNNATEAILDGTVIFHNIGMSMLGKDGITNECDVAYWLVYQTHNMFWSSGSIYSVFCFFNKVIITTFIYIY